MKTYLHGLRFIATIVTAMLTFTFTSCDSDDVDIRPPYYPTEARRTVLMYLPWAGTGLYNALLNNITMFEKAIEDGGGLGSDALLIFVAENGETAHMIQVGIGSDGQCVQDTLKKYYFTDCNYTTAEGITTILNDAMAAVPADSYAMTVGCHGLGWLPKGTCPASRVVVKMQSGYPMTRFFGTGVGDDSRYQTDVTALAKGVEATGVKLDYILFDDCYMANVETAYTLRNATDYLIGSTSEVMDIGMPYHDIGKALLQADMQKVVANVTRFYESYTWPYVAIGVIDCREAEATAEVMRKINTAFPFGMQDDNSVQDLDGYTPTIFYDMGSYVDRLCTDETLKATFNEQMARLVPYKGHTERYVSFVTGKRRTYPINTFSGITISDPTRNTAAKEAVKPTELFLFTH